MKGRKSGRRWRAGLLAWLCLLALPGCASPQESVLRVACVGDSITYGHMMEQREHNSYPAQLQLLLGDGYLVENFGVSGYALQKNGDFSYWDHEFFTESADFAPDIVLLMLGTNDVKDVNWHGTEAFAEDYRAMVRRFLDLPSKPQVCLMTPASLYAPKDPRLSEFARGRDRLAKIADLIRAIAQEENLPLIDIREATAGQRELFVQDGIHTTVAGATVIAEAACRVLTEAPP